MRSAHRSLTHCIVSTFLRNINLKTYCFHEWCPLIAIVPFWYDTQDKHTEKPRTLKDFYPVAAIDFTSPNTRHYIPIDLIYSKHYLLASHSKPNHYNGNCSLTHLQDSSLIIQFSPKTPPTPTFTFRSPATPTSLRYLSRNSFSPSPSSGYTSTKFSPIS